MNWKRLRKVACMLAIAAGLFNLPAYVLAHHDEGGAGETQTDAGLLFSVPGCQAADTGLETL
ncbi:MAG: hypothetical protein ACE5E5_07210 [Phycisphaerae bacterium]